MTLTLRQRLATTDERFFADKPKQRPSEWCVQNLRFDEASNHGPFTVAGREYCIEPLDDFSSTQIKDEVLVWGSQTHKTGTLMGGAAWSVVNDPCGILWVMPSRDLCASFSRNRWQTFLKASQACAELIPTKGMSRHNFKTLEQQIGAAVLNFAGSNSPGNISSHPCRRVFLDEVDKFNSTERRDAEGNTVEADAVNLAEQRTKDQTNPQRWKTSTPTLVQALIWQEALKGDMRRYFIPCKGCGKQIVLAWSPEYTVLPKTGKEAYIRWDKEAKRKNDWDLDRVFRSARAECPHCGFHNLDAYKTWQNRNGVWTATQSSDAAFVSRHLPSLYSPSSETTYGQLAIKFLQAKHSLLGLQGFINGDLAEPYQSQDTQSERVELITSKLEVTAEWRKNLTVDCQQKAPLFWYVIRAWNGGDSQGIEAGPLDSWQDVELRQKAPENNIKDVCCAMESGFGARSEHEVYFECARHGTFVDRPDKRPLHIGWIATKGMPGRKRWRNEDGLLMPYALRPIDPFYGRSGGGVVEMNLLEFSADFFKDILESLRQGKGGHKWTVLESCSTEVYWHHLDSEVKKAVFNKMTGKVVHQWCPRSKYWPNHLHYCETMQLVQQTMFGAFREDLVTK